MGKDTLGCTGGTSALIAAAPLSLRDQIALIVLVEQLKHKERYQEDWLADSCYSMADAMLRARGQ